MKDFSEEKEKSSVLPVFFWIFLVATLAVLVILFTTLLDRNGTIDGWKAQYKEWKEEKEAAERAERAGEKTVHRFGPSGVAEYESWFAGEWKNAIAQGIVENPEGLTDATKPDPLREALTQSPVNGAESWWSEAKKLVGDVALYAQAETPLYAAPSREGTVYGYGRVGEVFRLLAVFEDGWYVVTDGQYYYCSEGSHYTMAELATTEFSALQGALEKEKVFHEVETVLQNPELPHGCEVTGLASLLSYYGVDADKCELADQWLAKGVWGMTDFHKAFVGDPRKRIASAGCYAPVIAETANRYLKSPEGISAMLREPEKNGGRLNAVAKENVSFTELLTMLQEAPVLAWTTMELRAPYIAQVWTVEGEELYWQNYEHCVVLTGYDLEKGVLYGTDPLYGPCEYEMKLFDLRFQTMYSQVVQITKEAP